MNRADYDRYLAAFNARDYEGVLAFYADAFELRFAGHCFCTKDEVRAFYRFFHSHVREEILLDRFVADGRTVALEAVVQLTAERDLDAATLAEAGYAGLFPLVAGTRVRMEQFIHYHLEEGRIVAAICALAAAPEFGAV